MLRCVCITMSVVLIDIMVFLELGEIGWTLEERCWYDMK